MMMAMRVGLNNAKKFFPRFRSSAGAQFHSQSFFSELSNRFLPVTTEGAVSVLFWCGLIEMSTGWLSSNGRGIFEEWKGKYKMQKMLEELDRKKMESSEAYLEMIHREMEALKPRLIKREEMAEWEFNKYEREIAVLRSKLYEWTQGMDDPASASASALASALASAPASAP